MRPQSSRLSRPQALRCGRARLGGAREVTGRWPVPAVEPSRSGASRVSEDLLRELLEGPVPRSHASRDAEAGLRSVGVGTAEALRQRGPSNRLLVSNRSIRSRTVRPARARRRARPAGDAALEGRRPCSCGPCAGGRLTRYVAARLERESSSPSPLPCPSRAIARRRGSADPASDSPASELLVRRRRRVQGRGGAAVGSRGSSRRAQRVCAAQAARDGSDARRVTWRERGEEMKPIAR